MSNLSQLLEEPTRTSVVTALVSLVDNTVSEQSGITGMAIKGAVAAAKKVDADIVSKGINRTLPDLLGEMESYWQEFDSSPQEDFGTYLAGNNKEVADSILGVADRNADQVNNPALVKTYNSLRNKIAKIIEPQVPELARILQKHM
ncbi:hypothetical protein HMPREF2724_02615 [Corynebacterium sp. HMSC071F07]|uniref:DUF6918 family protein n=1 Tax=Corynebacterium sp. HMSC071F07 TaxID=1715203 RepID=UPI0008A3174C|nr:hypothetical protein [Corynebacterium sp. HMSC071F07]OFM04428.1 hypothetical protein HMPREF2724_02615 [Corynebacterium sp. HMSC071F07]